MTLQVLPPELLEQPKDRIETKEPQPYWKPSSLKDGESEEFRLLGCYETGHAIMGWQYASRLPVLMASKLMVTSSLVVTLALLQISLGRPIGKPDRPIDGSDVNPRRFLAWVAICSRGRLEVLFIEQKSFENNSLKSARN